MTFPAREMDALKAIAKRAGFKTPQTYLRAMAHNELKGDKPTVNQPDADTEGLLRLSLQFALERYTKQAKAAKTLAEYDRPARIRDGLTLTLAALAEAEYNNQPEEGK